MNVPLNESTAESYSYYVQDLLKQNDGLISSIEVFQRQGKTQECIHIQQLLHRNLRCIALLGGFTHCIKLPDPPGLSHELASITPPGFAHEASQSSTPEESRSYSQSPVHQHPSGAQGQFVPQGYQQHEHQQVQVRNQFLQSGSYPLPLGVRSNQPPFYPINPQLTYEQPSVSVAHNNCSQSNCKTAVQNRPATGSYSSGVLPLGQSTSYAPSNAADAPNSLQQRISSQQSYPLPMQNQQQTVTSSGYAKQPNTNPVRYGGSKSEAPAPGTATSSVSSLNLPYQPSHSQPSNTGAPYNSTQAYSIPQPASNRYPPGYATQPQYPVEPSGYRYARPLPGQPAPPRDQYGYNYPPDQHHNI